MNTIELLFVIFVHVTNSTTTKKSESYVKNMFTSYRTEKYVLN